MGFHETVALNVVAEVHKSTACGDVGTYTDVSAAQDYTVDVVFTDLGTAIEDDGGPTRQIITASIPASQLPADPVRGDTLILLSRNFEIDGVDRRTHSWIFALIEL